MKKVLIFGIGILLLFGITYQVSRTFRNAKEVESLSKSTDLHAPEGSSHLSDSNVNQMAGSSGSASTTENKAGVAVNATTKSVPEKSKENCFAFEYRHTKAAQAQDIENFLDYTNAFPLLHPNFNPKSICVKVNQKTVEFQLAKNKTAPEVRIGSVVGPESVIRVSYCIGKASCKENCVAPKKHFMDDVMNSPGEDESFSDSWGSGDTEGNQKEVKAKAKELRSIASESESLNENSIIRNWETIQKQDTVCKEKK